MTCNLPPLAAPTLIPDRPCRMAPRVARGGLGVTERRSRSMCGIFGYVGEPADVGPMVLGALRQLEYRGYDSWGVATRQGGGVAVRKRAGRIGEAAVALPPSPIGF